MPPSRGGRNRSVYPFDALAVGQSFHVPASEAKPNPAKSLASTVSSANKRNAKDGGSSAKFEVRSVKRRRLRCRAALALACGASPNDRIPSRSREAPAVYLPPGLFFCPHFSDKIETSWPGGEYGFGGRRGGLHGSRNAYRNARNVEPNRRQRTRTNHVTTKDKHHQLSIVVRLDRRSTVSEGRKAASNARSKRCTHSRRLAALGGLQPPPKFC
jgi:hypothetical protein